MNVIGVWATNAMDAENHFGYSFFLFNIHSFLDTKSDILLIFSVLPGPHYRTVELYLLRG